jgi:hypothetical protein
VIVIQSGDVCVGAGVEISGDLSVIERSEQPGL